MEACSCPSLVLPSNAPGMWRQRSRLPEAALLVWKATRLCFLTAIFLLFFMGCAWEKRKGGGGGFSVWTNLEVDVVSVIDLDTQHLSLGLLNQHPEVLVGPHWVQRIFLVCLPAPPRNSHSANDTCTKLSCAAHWQASAGQISPALCASLISCSQSQLVLPSPGTTVNATILCTKSWHSKGKKQEG